MRRVMTRNYRIRRKTEKTPPSKNDGEKTLYNQMNNGGGRAKENKIKWKNRERERRRVMKAVVPKTRR